MSSDALTVLQRALALPDDDRAGIAAELLASLPVPDGMLATDSEEWLREIESRARGVLTGEAVTADWDTVEQRILGKLS